MRCAAIAVGAVLGSILGPMPLRGAEVQPQPIPVVDLHVDLPYQIGYKHRTLDRGSGDYLASELVASGVLGVVLPLYVPKHVSPEGPRAADLQASYERVVRHLPRTPPYALPGCAPKSGSVLTWLAFEGAAPLAAAPETVDGWVRRGVRLFGLVHTYDNALATSSAGGTMGKGLTPAGRDVARRVFRARAVVDVSHASDRATEEILDLADELGGVVVASHSNARAVSPHPRNVTDAQATRIAATGGVVGVNFHARFLNGSHVASIADVVRHVRHLVSVTGVDHVAIGSDFEGDIRPPRNLGDVRGFPALSRALQESGLSRSEVSKIFHENALRVLCPEWASTD